MNPIRLHIGLTKTGSSSLQRFLTDERRMLAASGIVYPLSGRGRHGTAHHNLFYEISGGQRGHGKFDAALGGWDSLLAEIDEIEGRTANISSEAFQYCAPREVGQWANLLGPRQSKMVAYARRQDQWLESAWNQRARFGRASLDFREFLESHGRVVGDYARTLSLWIDTFGDLRLGIRVYDRLTETPGIVADFLPTYVPGGCHPVASRTDIRKNAGAGVKQLFAVDHISRACRAKLGDDFLLPRRSAARISEYFRGRQDLRLQDAVVRGRCRDHGDLQAFQRGTRPDLNELPRIRPIPCSAGTRVRSLRRPAQHLDRHYQRKGTPLRSAYDARNRERKQQPLVPWELTSRERLAL